MSPARTGYGPRIVENGRHSAANDLGVRVRRNPNKSLSHRGDPISSVMKRGTRIAARHGFSSLVKASVSGRITGQTNL